jgi:effector-binding domain-containing protein
MTTNKGKALYKLLGKTRVFQMRIHGEIPEALQAIVRLQTAVGDSSRGFPFVIHHWGVTDKKGHDMDVCIPIDDSFNSLDFETLTLPAQGAMTIFYEGRYDEINEAYRKVFVHAYERGHPIAESTREVFLHFNRGKQERIEMEIQAILHNWSERFSESLSQTLGKEMRDRILAPMSGVDVDTPVQQRRQALCRSLSLLDECANDDQKHGILAHCSHVFPVELIPPYAISLPKDEEY